LSVAEQAMQEQVLALMHRGEYRQFHRVSIRSANTQEGSVMMVRPAASSDCRAEHLTSQCVSVQVVQVECPVARVTDRSVEHLVSLHCRV